MKKNKQTEHVTKLMVIFLHNVRSSNDYYKKTLTLYKQPDSKDYNNQNSIIFTFHLHHVI